MINKFLNCVKLFPALLLALSYSVGIIIAHLIPISLIIFGGLWFISLLLYIRFSSFRNIIILFLFGLCAGEYYHLRNRDLPSEHIGNIIRTGVESTFEGYIDNFPQSTAKGQNFILNCESLTCGVLKYPVRGRIQVYIRNANLHLVYAMKLSLRAKAYEPLSKENTSGFDYYTYLKRKEIWGVAYVLPEQIEIIKYTSDNYIISKIIVPFRNKALRMLRFVLSEGISSILEAMLWGEKSNLSKEIREIFSSAGVLHILAISGLHIGMFVIMLYTLLHSFTLPPNIIIIGTFIILLLYLMMIGFPASATRAGIMASVLLLARLIQRRSNIYNTLGIAVLIMLFIRPNWLFDVGFQLSFAGVFSIIYGMSNLIKRFELPSNKILQYFIILFFTSLFAMLGTMPLSIYYFHKFSLISMIANFFVIPLAPVILALGFIISISSLFYSQLAIVLAHFCAYIISFLLKYLIGTLQILIKLPSAYFIIEGCSLKDVFIYYLLVLILFQSFLYIIDKKAVVSR